MDIYTEPDPLDTNALANLGPLAPLAGIWEGSEGLDIAPKREGPEETPYRERLTLEPCGPVVNGPQVLYGLRYTTVAWPIGSEEPFHEEVGTWLWDPARELAMRCFVVPRGVTVLAGGRVKPDARRIEMAAEVGSHTFGISSNPFLDEAFKTVRYELVITVHDDGRFSYEEDTQLKVLGQEELFHHKDRNTLARVGE